MLDRELTLKEYKELKAVLEDQLTHQSGKDFLFPLVKKICKNISFSYSLLKNFDNAYKQANLEIKQRIMVRYFQES